MISAPPRTWAPYQPAGLSLPRWTFVAWLVHCRQLRAGPRPILARAPESDIEARRRARLMREIVPT